jgi:Domain of unknown function (DUF4279)
MHDSLQPDAISELLQLVPGAVSSTGDSILRRAGYHIVSPANYWSMRSDRHLDSNSLEIHLHWMLGQLFGRTPAIRSLQNSGGSISLGAHLEVWSRVIGPELNAETLQQLAQLRIPLQFMCYQDTHQVG